MRDAAMISSAVCVPFSAAQVEFVLARRTSNRPGRQSGADEGVRRAKH